GLAGVTGDGVYDVIVDNFGVQDPAQQTAGGSIEIFQGNSAATGHGNFTFSNTPIVINNNSDISFIPVALAVGDFDGDGFNDIAAAVPGIPTQDPVTGQNGPPPDGTVDIFKGSGSGFSTT